MNGASYWRDWQGMSPAARLLITNGLAFNLGFYMMMPFPRPAHGQRPGPGWLGLWPPRHGDAVFSQQALPVGRHPWGSHRLPSRHRLGLPGTILGLRAAGLGRVPAHPAAGRRPHRLCGALFTPAPRPTFASECHNPSQRQRASPCTIWPARRACMLRPPGRPHLDPAELGPRRGSWRRALRPARSAAIPVLPKRPVNLSPPWRHLAPMGR